MSEREYAFGDALIGVLFLRLPGFIPTLGWSPVFLVGLIGAGALVCRLWFGWLDVVPDAP
jgi:hypothetical protein